MNKSINFKKNCVISLIILIVWCLAFCVIAREQIYYTEKKETYSGETASVQLPEIVKDKEILQDFYLEDDFVDGVELYLALNERENYQTIEVSIVNMNNDEVLDVTSLEINQDTKEGWTTVETKMIDITDVEGGHIGLCISSKDGNYGSAVVIPYTISNNIQTQLLFDGEVIENAGLCAGIMTKNHSDFAEWYKPFFIVVIVLGIIYVINLINCEKNNKASKGLRLIGIYRKYKFLAKQLIARDFKTKYKRSVLGVFWSFLNPLLTMTVQYLIFSNLFRFEIEYYPVYLLSGIVIYNGFNDCTTQAMMSIISNSALITKVYMPKYIYPITKAFSASINLWLSLLPLLIISLFQGLRITWAYLFLPYGLICVFIFIVGVSMLLSSLMVFFRDTQFLWSVFTMIWMYATPIIYPISILPEFMRSVMAFNPMYYFIDFMRTIIIEGISPQPVTYLICILWALGALLVGCIVFKKTQDKFVLYI